MAENIVASMSATIEIDKRETLEKLITLSKEAQTYVDKHKITYKFTSDKSDLARVMKEIEGLSPEIKAGVVLDFDSTDFRKKLDKLNEYATQDAKKIGENIEDAMTKSLKSINIAGILSSKLGEGTKATKTNLDTVFKDLKKQIDGFDIGKATSVEDIKKYITALKEFEVVANELKGKKVGRTEIDADFISQITKKSTNIFAKAGEIIHQNASQWAIQLRQTYETEFGNLQTLVNNFTQGLNVTLGGGNIGDGLSKEIEEVKAALEEAIAIQNQLENGAKNLKDIEKSLTDAYKASEKAGGDKQKDKKFAETFQQYIKSGGDVKKLKDRNIVDYYKDLSKFDKKILPIDKIERYQDALTNAKNRVAELTAELDVLHKKQAENPMSTSDAKPGKGTGGSDEAPAVLDNSEQLKAQEAEIKTLREQLELAKTSLSTMTDELTKLKGELGDAKFQAEGFQSMWEAAEESVKSLEARLASFGEGQVPIGDFNELKNDLDACNASFAILNEKFKERNKDATSLEEENAQLQERLQSQQKDIDEVQHYRDALEQSNKQLDAANKTIDEQTSQLDEVIRKYNEICDRLATIDKFLGNFQNKKYNVDGLQVATDALNKEYSELTGEYQKDKAAVYYGQYVKNGGKEKLYQNGVDVSAEILQRYSSIMTECADLSKNQKQDVKTLMTDLQSQILHQRAITEELEKQNKKLREQLEMAEEAKRIAEAMARIKPKADAAPTTTDVTPVPTPAATPKPTQDKKQTKAPARKPAVATKPSTSYVDPNARNTKDDGEFVDKKVKIVPDTSTFKKDSETELSKINIEKTVKLIPDASTFKEDSITVLEPIIIEEKPVKLTPDASIFKEDAKIALEPIALEKHVELQPVFENLNISNNFATAMTAVTHEEIEPIPSEVINSYEKLFGLITQIKNVDKSSYSGKHNTSWIEAYGSQEEAIAYDLAHRKNNLHSSLNLILTEDKNALDTLQQEADKLKTSLQPVQDLVNRISSNSSISYLNKDKGSEDWYKGYAEAYKTIDDRLGELNKQYDLTNEELEEFITLQVKADKILSKIADHSGGVKGSGAKSSHELITWIEKSFARDLGLNPDEIYNGLFSNITDAFYSSNLTLYDSEGVKKSLREISAEILKYKSSISVLDGALGANEDDKKLREINAIIGYIQKNVDDISNTDFSVRIEKLKDDVEWYSTKLSEGEDSEYYTQSLEKTQAKLQELIELQERLNRAREAGKASSVSSGQDNDASSSNQKADAFAIIQQSVISLTEAIEKKTEAITQEKIAMDVAAQDEVKSIQSIIDKIDELDQKIRNFVDLKINIVGAESLEAIDTLDFDKLQISETTLNNLTTLSYVLDTLRSTINEISQLNLSNTLNKDTLSGIKFTQGNADALESVSKNLPSLNNALTNFDSVKQTADAVQELIKKVATLKGVVDNVKNIQVEIVENTTTGTTTTKVNGKKNVDPDEHVALSSVLSQKAKDYDDIAKAARKANPALSETLKVVQQLRRNDDGSFAQSFVVSDDKGNSATVNKNGRYYMGRSVVKDDIAKAKQEQKELNDAVKEYQQHLKEIQALDAKNTKTKESNANYLLSEQLKTIEKIAKLKAQIITRESRGEDVTVLKKKIRYEKKYLDSLGQEMEYYEGTRAYQDRDAAVKGKTKETNFIVDDAKALAKQKADNKAKKKRQKDELALQKQLNKEEEQFRKESEKQAQVQQKKWKAFEKEQQNYNSQQYENDAINRRKKANQELIDTVQQYGEVSKRIANNKSLAGDVELAEKLELKISELQKQPILSPTQIEESERKLVKLFNELDVIEKTVQKNKDASDQKAEKEAAEAQEKRAKEVADAQFKYEQDLITQKQKANQDYIDWWSDASKQTNTDYSDLENVLSRKTALTVKGYKGELSPKEQAELNNLLAEEAKLRKEIENHGIADTDADNNLATKESVLLHEELSVLYDQAIDKQEKIYSLQVKQAKGTITNDEQTELNTLLDQQKNRETAIEDYKKRGIVLDKKAIALQQKKNDLATDLVNITGGKVYESGSAQKNQYDKAQDVDAGLYIPSVSQKIAEAQAQLTSYYNQLNDGTKRSKKDIDELNEKFNEQLKLIQNLSSADNLLNNKGLQYFGGEFTGSLEENKDAIISYMNTLGLGDVAFETFTRGHQSMIVSIRTKDNQIEKYEMSVKDATNALYGLYKGEKAYTSIGAKWIAGVKNKIFQLTQYLSGIEIIQRVWSELRQGFTIIRELDTALTEMRKVSNETTASLRNFQDASFDIAKSVGAAASTIQNSTADWMRLGESLDEAAESAKVANILLNVSEFESINEATDSLVSMSQAYKELDKIDIVDKLNNVGNNFAISTDGLATALQKSASALKTAGNDIDEAIALTTAGNAIAQDPDSVGAGLRTISLRLVGTAEAKKELESLGEEVDDAITTTSKLRQTILSATKAATEDGNGFDIFDDNGNYKSTYEIMQGLADLYDDIVAKDKELGTNNLNLLLESIAGKNRANIAASILQNGDVLKSVFESAKESEGSAQQELGKYLDSIEGKIAQLTNAVQEFWYTFIDTDLVKGAIDVLTNIVELGTKFVDTFGSVGATITATVAAIAGYSALPGKKEGGGRAKNLIPLL